MQKRKIWFSWVYKQEQLLFQCSKQELHRLHQVIHWVYCGNYGKQQDLRAERVKQWFKEGKPGCDSIYTIIGPQLMVHWLAVLLLHPRQRTFPQRRTPRQSCRNCDRKENLIWTCDGCMVWLHCWICQNHDDSRYHSWYLNAGCFLLC